VRRHRIAFVDDASNHDERFARSRLRAQVMPALRAAFADADHALADAARRAAREQALIAEIAHADRDAVRAGGALRIERWSALSPARRHECLRAWLADGGIESASEAQIERLVRELPAAARPARWPVAGHELRRYRGLLTACAAPDVPAAAPPAPWPCAAGVERAGTHAVPGTPDFLRTRRSTAGVPQSLLQGAQWCARLGGERFQRAPGTPPRSLKKQFQAAGVPAWSREAPLLCAADGAVLFVPGLGTDARALAAPGSPRLALQWLAGEERTRR
jgi:tRNA(Ile)-lysidine synthase